MLLLNNPYDPKKGTGNNFTVDAQANWPDMTTNRKASQINGTEFSQFRFKLERRRKNGKISIDQLPKLLTCE